MNTPDLKVVLVRPIYESNIGATSRAMANMGVNDLILIAPQCEIGMTAKKAAATGQDALENRQTFPNWSEFYKNHDNGIRIALTARAGKGRAARDLQETLKYLKTTELDNRPIYFIFGPEDWGLSTEDLDLVHYSCTLPTYGENPSLNLAQASLLTLFIFRDIFGGERTAPLKRLPPSEMPEANAESFNQTLEKWINELGYKTDDHSHNAHIILRRIILQNLPTKKELAVLETILQQAIRKLQEYKEYLRRHGPLGKFKQDNIKPESEE